ncbi:hypothetical protein PFISCL1PPCAC_7524, partial [Pristionchus fissidentatus]
WLESLPAETSNFLLENGSLIFYKRGPNQLLYGWGKNCKSFAFELLQDELLECAGAAGNTLFFYSKSISKYAFYSAKFDEEGETIQFQMTYEKVRTVGETMWLALQQPFFQLMPSKNDGVFEIETFVVFLWFILYACTIL